METPINPAKLEMEAEQPVQSASIQSITFGSTKEFQVVACNNTPTFLTSADLKGPFFEPKSRAPINFITVIDRSGSMDGNKLKLVKETLNFVITQLKSSDRFGMVTFESNVNTDLELTKMNGEGKELARTKIRNICIGGSTNLSGGLFAGLDLIQPFENEITSVLLLTDGLANVGITESSLLVDALKKQIGQRPSFTLFTFGFGSDHDEKMLKSLSENGKGLYYFIENEDAIPKAFGDCLGGLISVVAQNIKLRFEPLAGTVIQRVITKYPKQEETTETGETIHVINLGDLYSEEERNIVCEVKVPLCTSETYQCKILSLSLEYFNVLTSTNEKVHSSLFIDRLEVVPSEYLIPNFLLDKQRNRILAADALEKANDLGKSGKLEDARKELNTVIEHINQSVSANETFCQELIKDLKEALKRLRDQDSYVTSGSKYMTSHGMSHYYQRSSHTTPMYQTYSKMTTMEQASSDPNEDEEVD